MIVKCINLSFQILIGRNKSFRARNSEIFANLVYTNVISAKTYEI
jgi:hypothetical protein